MISTIDNMTKYKSKATRQIALALYSKPKERPVLKQDQVSMGAANKVKGRDIAAPVLRYFLLGINMTQYLVRIINPPTYTKNRIKLMNLLEKLR